MTTHFKTAVFFGGAGFIGTHLAAYFLQHKIVEHLFITDIAIPDASNIPAALKPFADAITYLAVDVRKPINNSELPPSVDLIVNLAAVHREPGHQPLEYFATNLPGAENICAWAEEVSCPHIVFTSSIATYGTEVMEPKSEKSLPAPLTPYGISKLVAEKIHLAWQSKNSERKLLIVRPGVIFGNGERGNVTRMVRAILGHYFFFSGNKNTKKAGGYVKELCAAIAWMLNKQVETNQPYVLFNFSMDPAPTVSEYAQAIVSVSGKKRFIPTVPFSVLLLAARLTNGAGKLFGLKTPTDPVRVQKLLRSNDIIPNVLKEAGYQYHYTLPEALRDWKQEQPVDWQ
jgi:nucleoside-diphosphate-sugar epimerase